MKRKIFLLLSLSSCMVGPNRKQPDISMPEQFIEIPEKTENIDLTSFWTQFNDPLLTSLIEEAESSNLDLAIAQEKVTELRALYQIARAPLFPEIDLVGSFNRQKNSKNSFGTTSSTLITTPTPFTSIDTVDTSIGPQIQNLFQIGFDASWELDFFGKIRRSKEAAFYDVEASEFNASSVKITLLAEVAQLYIAIRALQQLITLSEERRDFSYKLYLLANDRYQAGLTSEIEVQRAKAILDTDEAAIAPLKAELKATIYHMAVSLGKQPEDFIERFTKLENIPEGSGKIPEYLPSELLLRRPDVRKAEKEIDASGARIGVAIADLFPQFSLTGGLGYESNKRTDLLKSSSITWNFGPTFSWPIFAGGRIVANIHAHTSLQKQALLNYEKTVLASLEEVETALSNYFQENNRYRAYQEEVEATYRSSELTHDLFNAGLVNYSLFLEENQKYIDAKHNLLTSKQNLMRSLIAIYKALGGGW